MVNDDKSYRLLVPNVSAVYWLFFLLFTFLAGYWLVPFGGWTLLGIFLTVLFSILIAIGVVIVLAIISVISAGRGGSSLFIVKKETGEGLEGIEQLFNIIFVITVFITSIILGWWVIPLGIWSIEMLLVPILIDLGISAGILIGIIIIAGVISSKK